ncbi:MAG: tetraacyldisaccharide 4'-kinase [Bacteroidales bacterium]|nr:tetraacyldisaccharide 4'-kinase [Bacteroidales bacterium]
MYLLITIIRNFLFDCGIIKAKRYKDVKVLCIGNIRVGGTGKTPMIEYLIRKLNDEFTLSVVSLGYKRKSKGLKEVLSTDSATEVGDEPKQMKDKFPNIPFFVNKDRNVAIDFIRKNIPTTQVILLDDAFQFRKTQPDISVLLTEYNRPYFNDCIMPYGRLRERRKESKRADYIIVTKCPADISDDNKKDFIKKLNPLEHQQVFFSKIHYTIKTMQSEENLTEQHPKNTKLLFVAGIDNPAPAVEFLKGKGYEVTLRKFADHHTFTQKEIIEIKNIAKKGYRIITTEKDAVRLKSFDINFDVLCIENRIDDGFTDNLKEKLRR